MQKNVRALFIDVLEDDQANQFEKISVAFRKNDPRLTGLKDVLINPPSPSPQ